MSIVGFCQQQQQIVWVGGSVPSKKTDLLALVLFTVACATQVPCTKNFVFALLLFNLWSSKKYQEKIVAITTQIFSFSFHSN